MHPVLHVRAVIKPPVVWQYASASSDVGHPWPSKGTRASVRPWYSCCPAGVYPLCQSVNVPWTVPGPSHMCEVINPPSTLPYESTTPGVSNPWLPNDGMLLERPWYSLSRVAPYPSCWFVNVPRTVTGPSHTLVCVIPPSAWTYPSVLPRGGRPRPSGGAMALVYPSSSFGQSYGGSLLFLVKFPWL